MLMKEDEALKVVNQWFVASAPGSKTAPYHAINSYATFTVFSANYKIDAVRSWAVPALFVHDHVITNKAKKNLVLLYVMTGIDASDASPVVLKYELHNGVDGLPAGVELKRAPLTLKDKFGYYIPIDDWIVLGNIKEG